MQFQHKVCNCICGLTGSIGVRRLREPQLQHRNLSSPKLTAFNGIRNRD